jgi:hypothetical protein
MRENAGGRTGFRRREYPLVSPNSATKKAPSLLTRLAERPFQYIREPGAKPEAALPMEIERGSAISI